MGQHAEFHYSITIKTDDLAVLHCLRSLSQYAQKSGNKRIPWGGTKESDWRSHDHCGKFHFTSPLYRRDFLAQLERLLPKGLWEKVKENDSDPATPQDRTW
jgi:hypothetical protein